MHTSTKKWLGRLVLMTCVPLALIALLELGARITRLGYPTTFLVPVHIHDTAYWATNPFYGYRFFDPLVARNPAPLLIKQDKDPAVKRVVVLGESAAMGDPAIEFSLARSLDKLLNEPAAPRQFEVLNAAMTAISSPIIVDIADEWARKGTDAFVVYMGNNEVIGPYGPDTVFARSSPPWITALRVRLTRLRLASILQAATATRSLDRSWQGMEMFATRHMRRDDPRMTPVYDQFETNLERLIHLARTHGIRVILATVAVNLADFAPLGSQLNPALPETDRTAWNRAFAAGAQAQQEGHPPEASTRFEQALTYDDTHAELLFRHARTQTNPDTAAHLLAAARDHDTQRIRTDAAMNKIIRNVAARHPDVVTLADVEHAFGPHAGNDLFLDHVHFTAQGLYHASIPIHAALAQSFTVPATIDEDTWQQRLFFSPWSLRKQAALMRQRRQQPPLNGQWQNEQHLRTLDQTIRQANTDMQNIPTEWISTEAQHLMTLYPHDPEYAAQWTQKLTVAGHWQEAQTVFEEHLQPRLTGFSAHHNLGLLIYAMNGHPEKAATLLASIGPPYGYYPLDTLFALNTSLQAMDRPDAARQIAARFRAHVARFPGSTQIDAWLEQNQP
jgi:hypothetical protein